MKKIFPTLLLLMLLMNSCTPEPKPIAYGDDLCQYCKMNIVDQQHAAELVSAKGKIFTFDAIECMINYKNENGEMDYAFELVNHYEVPALLIDVHSSYFLISEALPSPMGANLTAFANKSAALQMQDKVSGQIYNWRELQHHLLVAK